MSGLIRIAQSDGSVKPLFVLIGLAFLYGAIHAAGSGHGKVVAMSYVLSHRSTVLGGILFGFCFAFIHALSGAIGALGLRYIIQRGVCETLASVASVTQIVTFGLITLLGLGVLLKHGYALLFPSALDKGTGLGLYISNQTIRQHGGSISVESVKGQGSDFRTAIPKTLPEPAGLEDSTEE